MTMLPMMVPKNIGIKTKKRMRTPSNCPKASLGNKVFIQIIVVSMIKTYPKPIKKTQPMAGRFFKERRFAPSTEFLSLTRRKMSKSPNALEMTPNKATKGILFLLIKTEKGRVHKTAANKAMPSTKPMFPAVKPKS